jgi:hypothetical protein
MFKTIENLRMKPESYRHKVAFFTATALSLAIFVGWAGFKGYIGLPNGTVAYDKTAKSVPYQSKSVSGQTAVVSEAPSPFLNSINALKAAFGQFGEQYDILKESLSNVFVPFISGIEVYESK